MTKEFRNLEADAAMLRPRGLRPDVQARLLERLREEEAASRLEADLRRMTPAPLTETARRQAVAAVAAVAVPRHWGRWLAVAAAAAAVVIGGVLVLNVQGISSSDGGLLLANRQGSGTGSLQLVGVTRLPPAKAGGEFATAETVRTYVVNQRDGGIICLPNGQRVRQVSYDMVDEIRRPSSEVSGRYCVERVPRREVMYVAAPAE
jgi:hypothetical protein